MKKECEIVKDLFPNYIENRINDTTKEYVEEHIKNCKSCADILRSIRGGKQDKNEENNEVVINSLKKYNRKMFILKIIVAILSIFIIFIWGSFIVERVKYSIELKEDYAKGQYISEIIDTAYNKVEEIMNSDNYSIIVEETSVNYDLSCVYYYGKNEMFYKDGYAKRNRIWDTGSIKSYSGNNSTCYGVVAKDKRFFSIYLSEGVVNTSIGMEYGSSGNYYFYGFQKENPLEYKDFEIKEETIDGKNYYIIDEKENKEDGTYNTEIWIDKDSMILSKIVEEKLGSRKTEQKLTFSVNNVRDEDVKIKFVKENESSKKLLEAFEELKNFEGENYYEIIDKWNVSIDCSNVVLDKYEKTNKEVMLPDRAFYKVMIDNENGNEHGYGFSYKGVIFDQNGDAYYAYELHSMDGIKEVFEKNVFISIFGDTIKTNETEMDMKTGDMVIL